MELYFDGSVCDDRQGIGVVLVSPEGATFDFSSRLEFHCTNNQAEYEALLFGLELFFFHGDKACSGFWGFSVSSPASFERVSMF